MKRTVPIFLILAAMLGSLQGVYGQKHDRHWLGYDDTYSVVFLRFDQDGISFLPSGATSKIDITRGITAMSNAEGELQFYTNGNAVASWDNTVMEGGNGFNEGSSSYNFIIVGTDTIFSAYNPYTYQIIPDAHDEDIYYMVHAFVIEQGGCPQVYAPRMQISKIDMSANGGRGRVVYKNRYFDEELMGAVFALIRHGNGRDWWAVLRKQDGLAFKSVLLHRDTVGQVVRSTVPGLSSDWFSCGDWIATSDNILHTSPDGSKLVDKYGEAYAKLLAFDRCSGEVTLLDTFSTGIIALETVGGVVINAPIRSFGFSPSGSFLYGEGDAELAQWDLEADDIAASKVTLGGVPWALDENQDVKVGFRGGTYVLGLGPDGKIYNLMRWSHSVIEYPDEKGEASGLCLAADSPPSCLGVPYVLFSTPYPNYRLGPLEGSPCDTIRSDTLPPPGPAPGDYEVGIGPNPASGQVSIEISLPEYESGTAELEVVDMLGRVLYRHRFPPFAYLHQVDVSEWASGVYNVVLRHRNKLRATGRLVVAR